MKQLAISALALLLALATPCAGALPQAAIDKLLADSRADRATPAALRRATRFLERAVRLADKATEPGWQWQAAALRWELASLYARLGEKESALDLLEQAQQVAWLPQFGNEYASDPDFSALRAEPRFARLLAVGAMPQRLYGGVALASPYSEQLDAQQRVAGVSLLWSEARHGFAHFGNVPELDWDALYRDTLQQVLETGDSAAYYRLLMRMAAQLRDGHTSVLPPRELTAHFFSRPPLHAALVGARLLITEVGDKTLADRLRPGDEVLAIDSVPVLRYLDETVAPLVSASTGHARRSLLADHAFDGDAAQPLRLRLRDSQGREYEEVLARRRPEQQAAPAVRQAVMLPGQLAYVPIDSFTDGQSLALFEQFLPQILRAKGLIVDLRRNRGGSGLEALQVLSYLTRRAIPLEQAYARRGESMARAGGQPAIYWERLDRGDAYRLPRRHVFDGPVVVLTGPHTLSAAEDFVVSFQAMKRGMLVGEATGGSTGSSLSFALPGGGLAQLCVKLNRLPDGGQLVGKGVEPDVPVAQSEDDIRHGRDAALERAASILRTKR
ncbi:S41 family peptidase [Pseudoduganella sp. HUAS MS19]